MDTQFGRPINILLVEDNPGDAKLAEVALKNARVRNTLNQVSDGVEAMDYLQKRGAFSHVVRPDLILLDLNLPRMDGSEVLAAIKTDEQLKRIPVVVLTASKADSDILKSYNLHANCYITKPIDLDQFIGVVKHIEDFWLTVVKLPDGEGK